MAHRIKLRCDDFDVIGAVPRDLSVIKNFLKRDCAVKRLIDIEEDFLKQCQERGGDPMKPVQDTKRKSDAQPPPDPCASTTPAGDKGMDICDPCRRLKTSVVLEEVSIP